MYKALVQNPCLTLPPLSFNLQDSDVKRQREKKRKNCIDRCYAL